VTVTVTNDFRRPPPTTRPTTPTTVPSNPTTSPTVAPNVVTPAGGSPTPATGSTGAGSLAFTGSWTLPLVLVAFGLALFGAVLLAVRRRTGTTDSAVLD
jgi:hypothetical protein